MTARKFVIVPAVFALVLGLGGTVSAHHGLTTGHLPPTQHNVEILSKLKLTSLNGGIADVGYYKGYAYLNAWLPNCVDQGGTGAGVHVVDVRDPANPQKVGFLPAGDHEYPGEGIHVMTVDTPFFKGDLLLHNNEACNPSAVDLGMSIWDVTNPLSPKKLGQFGDADPPVGSTYHSIHSVQGFTQPGKAFAVLIDNNELKDVDIVDITNPAAPVFLTEQGLEDWPGAQGPYANGDTVFHHDVQFNRIDGHDFLAVSYWDAGQVILNVDNPATPVFVGDSNYVSPDPETGFAISEGNSHESYWSSNDKFLISSDEDFAPHRTLFEITTGANAGPYGGGEFGWTPPVDNEPGAMINGPTIFGGRGCFAAGPNAGPDVMGDPMPPPASAMVADPGEEKTVIFSRGGCFFSTKVAAGQDLGYDAVIIGQSHGGTRNGLLVDAFFCGGQGHDYDEQIPAICIGHRAMHLLFNDTPEYTGAEGADIPLSTLGEEYQASTEFDGWGYLSLHDATKPDMPIIDTYAIFEALHESFADNYGALTVHEVKTDPRLNVNQAYISYYAGGFRVAAFDSNDISEVGRFIGDKGNDFWGVFPIGDEVAGHGYGNPSMAGRPIVLLSDRDFGLYIARYTGPEPSCTGRDVTMLGTDGDDVLEGTDGDDVISARGGKDRVKGLGGKDRLCGGAGNDKLKGGGGKDRLQGEQNKDNCNGGPGKDKATSCEKKKSIP